MRENKFVVVMFFLLVFMAVGSYGAPKKVVSPVPVTPVVKSTAPSPTVKVPVRYFDAGYFAGSLGIRLGLKLPKDILQMEPRIVVGYGIGQNYGVSLLQGELVNYAGAYNYGVSVDLAGYSARVLGIPGLPDTIEQGNRFGFGAFVGTEVMKQVTRIGYSSALGYTLMVSKKF